MAEPLAAGEDRVGQTPLVLAVVLGLGALASLGLLVGAAQRYEWLLAVTGARPLVVGVAVLGIAVAGIALLAEERIGRLVVLVGALGGAVALLVLASADPRAVPAFEHSVAERALALALALVGADSVLRWRPGRARSPSRRLVRLDALPLWLGLGGLIGLPTVSRLEGLAAVAAERPELAVLGLAASVVGLVGIKRVADAVVTDGAEVREADERPPAWRRLVPLVLSVLYVVYALA